MSLAYGDLPYIWCIAWMTQRGVRARQALEHLNTFAFHFVTLMSRAHSLQLCPCVWMFVSWSCDSVSPIVLVGTECWTLNVEAWSLELRVKLKLYLLPFFSWCTGLSGAVNMSFVLYMGIKHYWKALSIALVSHCGKTGRRNFDLNNLGIICA